MKRITILAFILCSCCASLDWSQQQRVLPRIVQSAISNHQTGILLVGRQALESQTTSPIALKEKYSAVEVEKFDVLEGLQFPPEYVQSLQDEIVKEFGRSKTFDEVFLAGQNPTDATASVLRLTGTRRATIDRKCCMTTLEIESSPQSELSFLRFVWVLLVAKWE